MAPLVRVGRVPAGDISRTEGTARAHRDTKWGKAVWNQRPAWPWSLDETELGTADFRSIKYNIYEATLASPDGTGLTSEPMAMPISAPRWLPAVWRRTCSGAVRWARCR